MTRRLLPVVFLALALAGCGGGGDSTTSQTTSTASAELGTPLTRTQAQALARVLSNNAEKGGARFRLRNPLPDGRALLMTGQIDFLASKGTMLLQVEGTGGVPSRGRRLAWKRATIFEGDIPGLTAAMVKRGRPGISWVSRPAALAAGPVDESIAILNKLAAPKPENPVLLQQGKNAYVRSDVLGNTKVDVFRVGLTRLTATAADALLLKFEARIGTARTTGSVTLSGHGPQRVVLPTPATTVDLASIRTLYRQLVRSANG
jgi:hypothetical protein